MSGPLWVIHHFNVLAVETRPAFHSLSIMQIPSFTSGSYVIGSGKTASSRAVNLYPELSEQPTKNNEQYHYVATPGTSLLATMAGGKGRGLWAASNGRSFAV